MKLRNGFVSNSSSSSFIISQKEEDALKVTLEVPKDKIKIYKSIEEYCKANYIDENDLDEGDDYIADEIKRIKEELSKGNVIKEFKADSEDCDTWLSGLRHYKLNQDMFDKNTTIVRNGEF